MNFNIPVSKNFATQFNRLVAKYGDEMTVLNGFGDEQIGFTTFIDNFIDKTNVADASIDSNANVGHKDIVSLQSEMGKPVSKLLAFNKIYYELNKKYGFSTANKWLETEWNGGFYLHDAPSSTLVPYCFAYDIENLVNKGLYFIENFNGQPPQHLTTFTDFVGEFVSWTSNRSSGACGLPSFLVYSFYFWKKDCEQHFEVKNPEYYAKQEFQRIVYKLNQPYLRVNQSAFTNFSIFDRNYFEALFGGKEFPEEITAADGLKSKYMIDFMEEFIEYQKLFMEVVSDIRSKNMMTFPVLTYSLLRQNGKFVDEEFARWCSDHNSKWCDSNFFVSDSVTSLSNCCRLLSDIDNLGFFSSIGGTALEVGSVKVNTINLAQISYESKNTSDYLNILKERTILCCKVLDIIRHIISRNIEKGLLPNFSYKVLNLKSMYNTIGVIGIYETLQHFGMTYQDDFGYTYYTGEGKFFAKQILDTVNTVKDEFAADKDYQLNVEAVPKKCGDIVE